MRVESQFTNDQAVKELLNYSRYIVDQLNAGTGVGRRVRTYQYLAFAGMVSYYGFEHIDEITKAFQENSTICTGDTVYEYLADNLGYAKDVISFDSFKDASSLFHRRYFFNEANDSFKCQGNFIVSLQNGVSSVSFFENLVHEINHAVNSTRNSVSRSNNGKVYTRMGLKQKYVSEPKEDNRLLEEPINVLQTADIMNHIRAFSDYQIDDPDIKRVLDSIKYVDFRGNGYFRVTPLIRPLYEDRRFNAEVKERRLDGGISDIRSFFDAKTGTDAFEELSRTCDSIYDPTINNAVLTQRQGKVKKLVSYYLH